MNNLHESTAGKIDLLLDGDDLLQASFDALHANMSMPLAKHLLCEAVQCSIHRAKFNLLTGPSHAFPGKGMKSPHHGTRLPMDSKSSKVLVQ